MCTSPHGPSPVRRRSSPAVANRRAAQDEALEELYAQVPDMLDCKGLCHDSCGPIPTTKRETQRLDMLGVKIPHMLVGLKKAMENEQWRCPALGEDNLCTVYERRPLICRLYGTVDTPMLRCSHGCVPKGGYLTDEQGSALLTRADEVGGGFL